MYGIKMFTHTLVAACQVDSWGVPCVMQGLIWLLGLNVLEFLSLVQETTAFEP